MVVASTIREAREITSDWRKQGLKIGFVPTMGYLHDGHRSLMKRARSDNDKVVVSIFVNPMQFGPNEDYDRYPRDMERDAEICSTEGVDLVFSPPVAEMYPLEHLAFVDVKELGDGLCGAKRPGHFRGVCTVVAKLFNILMPDRAYFGEKDAQQLAIIKRFTQDLNFNIEIVPCPIVRESDGLAMSSRNTYLSTDERKAAQVIPRSLGLARKALDLGKRDAAIIKAIIEEEISREPMARIDYVEVVDASTLKTIDLIDKRVLVAVAVYIGKTRLIDNFTFEEGCR